ncbi:MAG TPA: hypothetical protein DCW72_08765 [Elusimicrobia bacterium]|nr:MAG: hypothetical protein A2X29_10635 [Elusimicrobia bacterium GWA2_64_40]OGR62698.1 MAG: hypothetical protein A2X30_07290 [Elusimicrobia bacterium GWB2_63_16]HAN05549.1 hypothetical protein [Elusimicrobiota bacterium]HAU90286.1 hypothetical protein [Elusimicrobiota bacterium]
MLKEAMHVMQVKGEPRRRWFDDEYFDLIVWFEPGSEIWGFQLCYDREWKPRALTWTRQYGYKHTGIDDGEHAPGASKSAPVLVADGKFDAPSVSARFERAAAEIPGDIAAFVLEKLKAHKL